MWSKPRPSALLLLPRGGGEKVAAAPPAPSVWSSGSACSSPAARCGAVAAVPGSPGAHAGPHKVCSRRPCAAELPKSCRGPAWRARRDPRSRRHADRRGRAERTLKELLRWNLRLHLASRGPREELV